MKRKISFEVNDIETYQKVKDFYWSYLGLGIDNIEDEDLE